LISHSSLAGYPSKCPKKNNNKEEAGMVTNLLKTVVGLVGIGVGALIGVAVTGSEDNLVAYVFAFIGLCVAVGILNVLGLGGRSSRRLRGGRRTYYPPYTSDYSSDSSSYDGGGDSGGSTGGDGGGGDYGGSG
jgi:uncharacterized membrane protein YgcG